MMIMSIPHPRMRPIGHNVMSIQRISHILTRIPHIGHDNYEYPEDPTFKCKLHQYTDNPVKLHILGYPYNMNVKRILYKYVLG